MKNLVDKLRTDYPAIQFKESDRFMWSSRQQQILFVASSVWSDDYSWALLHELGHALLCHQDYTYDIDLINIEIEAWQKAHDIARNYNLLIDNSYVQDCLDTYRNWLHLRSKCPICNTVSTQLVSKMYHCFNCQHIWSVTDNLLCRPYRRSILTRQAK